MEELTKNNMAKELKNPVVIVDFWATWCGPCRMFGPIFEEVAEEFEGQARFLKCDCDKNQELALKQGVMSIPCVIAYKNGQPVARQIGLVDKNTFENFVKNQF